MSIAECLVLGLLHEGLRYGHELDRAMARRNMRQWASISRIGIYQVLERLTRRGWVRAHTEQHGRMPERKVYTLTPAGAAGLRRLVAEGLASREPVRFRYSVPLAYLDTLPAAEAMVHLRRRRELVAGLRRHLDQDWRELRHQVSPGYRALLRHDRAFYRLEERWLDWLIRELAGAGPDSLAGREAPGCGSGGRVKG